jgi:tetratricopeptide (TPR) repeat protein
MEARFSRPGVRWGFLGGVLAAASALAVSGGKIALANHSAARETPDALARAARLEPANAQMWYLSGRYWQYNFEQPNVALAVSYYQRALALEPQSANTWMDLADAREELGDMAQAREAFERAQKAYPISADVAWRYANFLFRQKDIREAFVQVHRALQANPSLADAAFSFCWHANPDINEILDEALPRSAPVYLEAIRFLSSEHASGSALEVWKRLDALHSKIELKPVFPLLDELVAENLASEARTVWERAVQMAGVSQPAPPDGSLVWDGGFEGDFIEGGFGWRWSPHPGAQYAFDSEVKRSGERSLRITFDGRQNLNFGDLSQYVPVEPGTTYQFSAYVKTDDITTNRGISFAVFDPRDPGGTGRLTPELTGTHPWTHLELSFPAGPETHFIMLLLRRVPSEKVDNKLQGTVWVDDVSLVPAAGRKGSAR